MSKHTPGPWHIPFHLSGADDIGPKEGFEIITCCCCGGVRGNTKEQEIANARLIVAAPELLDTLQGAIALYGKFGAIVNDPHNPGEWITKAQQAVRRATE